ncbi:hypothetical protein CK203_030442 [Vitis vinifera]|uniref:Uncharacterized protein n=1 Tax=Vitis vinifera TaxID=29760 RepID=A0A438JDG4_VITVI|nr:hypothetical protein CK203_030442 [Vitis vinifera]
MALSHREKTVGKRATNAGSPPGDNEIERRKRCVRIQTSSTGPPRGQRSRGQVANSRPDLESIYPGTTGAIPETCNVRPQERHTPMHQTP